MVKRFAVLVAMLGLMLAAAVPAMAQEVEQEGYQYDVVPPDPASGGSEQEDFHSTLTF